MEYGKLRHGDLAIIQSTVGHESRLVKYNDPFAEDYDGDRMDYFSFFGTDITVHAEDVTVVTRVAIVDIREAS